MDMVGFKFHYKLLIIKSLPEWRKETEMIFSNPHSAVPAIIEICYRPCAIKLSNLLWFEPYSEQLFNCLDKFFTPPLRTLPARLEMVLRMNRSI